MGLCTIKNVDDDIKSCKIPKEIKNYREKLFFGLTLRQCLCAGAALLICVPLYIFGNKILSQEAVSWVVILVAVPLMLVGFFRYNDMMFEQFAVEFMFHNFTPQKRIYSFEPPFLEFRNLYLADELAAEIEAKENKSFIRKLFKGRKVH